MNIEKQSIANTVAPLVSMTVDDVAKLIEYPPNPEMGDLALPCFRFAKALRKSPQQIATDLRDALLASGQFEDVQVAGGYLNVRLNRSITAAAVVSRANRDIAGLFSARRGTGIKVAVDYSAPNIAKEFGVGHLRSTMIGQAIVRMLREDGHETIGINHLGDWGTQFGKNIVAYLRWGDQAIIQQNPVRELQKLYVKFHQEAVLHPELEDEARAWFKRLEDGDEEAVRLWQWFIDESMKTYARTYELLGVSFDYYTGESFYIDKMQPVVDELRSKGLLTESEGAEVVDLSEWNMPPCIIQKSDGATIYATRDLAAANYRHDVLGARRIIYVVGAEQTLHFAQVFKVLQLMGRSWASECRHVAFGLMKYNGEKLSTRKGKIVYLEDVLRRAIEEATAIIEQKNPSLANRDAVAKAVGVGAVVFNDLKNYRMHDVDFRFEDVLNFDGETGPYVQYTHTRACSVLRKAESQGMSISDDVVFPSVTDSEWRVVGQLTQANEWFERAADELDPSLIARFTLDLCHAFNRFYHDEPILTAEPSVAAGRLALTKAVREAIAHALYLLGLEAPTAM